MFEFKEGTHFLRVWSVPFPGGDVLAFAWVLNGQLEAGYRFRYYEPGTPVDADDRKSFYRKRPSPDSPAERERVYSMMRLVGQLIEKRGGGPLAESDVNGDYSKLHAAMLGIEGLQVSMRQESKGVTRG